jgi:hypothetical protein
MKNFVLEKVFLLSQKERKAKEIEFHPKKNLIVGVNHTGKSTLIKSIFKTLGATPVGKLKNWDETAITAVQFNAQGKTYTAVLNMGHRGLFDEDNELLAVTGNHADWSKIFAEITGFNLLVVDKDRKTVTADPACFFLPFYIDQDGSWQSKWDTFPSSKRFSSPLSAILEYFIGIKPFEWYQYDSMKRQAQQVLNELNQEKSFLDRAKSRLEKNLPMSGPKIHSDNFEIEIKKLSREVSELNSRQETLRMSLVREKELIESINMQIALSNDALAVYKKDSSYLQLDREKLICPVCEAEHDENFLDILNYAEDARVLQSLALELRKDLLEVTSKYQHTQSELQSLNAHYKNISELLEVKRGDMKFEEVVNCMSAEHAFNAFLKEADALEEQISSKLTDINDFNEKLTALTDKKRSKEILDYYRTSYASALIGLNIQSVEPSKQKLTSRPSLSGSGGPRQILAYYSALWCAAIKHGDFLIPLVIDSPNQQGQDHINLPKVLEFVSKKLPERTQIIIGSEVDTSFPFDKKIELSNQYKLLDESEFEHIENYFTNLTDAMISGLQSLDVT